MDQQDVFNTPQHWEAGFKTLARVFNLKYTPPADL